MGPYIVSDEKFPLLFLGVLGWNTRCSPLFQWRGARNAHRNAPHMCVDTCDLGPQMSARKFCWGSVGSEMQGILFFSIKSRGRTDRQADR